MYKFHIGGGAMPEYHEGMLIIKTRPAVGALGTLAVGPSGLESVARAPGLSALANIERSGMVKRVVPLARGSQQAPIAKRSGASALRTLAASAPLPDTNDNNAGVSIVEFQPDADLTDLQRALGSDPHIEFASRVPVRYLAVKKKVPARNKVPARKKASIRATPPEPSTLWNLRKIRWAESRNLSGFVDASDVKVAVLDTGIDDEHPDLADRIANYVYEHPDLPDVSSDRDYIGHGTHVAGTIAALINNELGINGICECQLHSWKIFDDVADYDAFDRVYVYYVEPVMYRRALADCLEQRIDVINLSIGGPGAPDPQEQALFDALLADGTVIVAAMGNERQQGSPTSYPAAIPGVIAVGATSLTDRVANFSNRGKHIAIAAPGVSIWSTLPTYAGQFGFEAVTGSDGQPKEGKAFKRETDYDAWDGTSMATPHVAAASALLVAAQGRIGPDAVKSALMKSADRVAGMRGKPFHQDYGAGRLNLLKLLS